MKVIFLRFSFNKGWLIWGKPGAIDALSFAP